jgi:DNA-binding PadR family transcriptional regulator
MELGKQGNSLYLSCFSVMHIEIYNKEILNKIIGGVNLGNENTDAVFDGLVLELRRGTIILSVLSQLKEPQYGYSLIVLLQEKGVEVDAGTLYPLLRRLEKQELLESSWDVESAKPRKYYKRSDNGNTIYDKLCRHWIEMVEKMDRLINNREVK